MENNKINLGKLIPVMATFAVMGFVDIVGVSTGYAQKDFGLSNSQAQLIPAMAFLWFLLLSVPAGILQDRFGKKRMMNVGLIITGIGMIVPFLSYSFPVVLFAFVLLGIGNTAVQVAANPLLQDVTPKDKLSSFLSLAQFLKAIVSLLGPVLMTFMAVQMGDWKLAFAVYALTAFLAVAWLALTPIEEYRPEREAATFSSCFGLLKNPFILFMVLAIFLYVGAEVGMNSNIQNILITQFGIPLEKASLGISLFFAALMVSRFAGAILLNFVKPGVFLLLTSVLSLLGLLMLIAASSATVALVAIFVAGLGFGNLFPLVFSIAINRMPDRSNEIAGLMVMAIVGGAVVPPIMGVVSSNMGVTASLFVLVACIVYVLGVALYARKE